MSVQPKLSSGLASAKAMREPWLAQRVSEFHGVLQLDNRKLWEFAAICQVFQELPSGSSCLGFGVGKEPLSAYFAQYGAARVVATDRADETQDWTATGQHARSRYDLSRECCSDDRFRVVEFRQVNMTAIPPDLTRQGFDFTWSAGSLEHIGGIEAGIDFVIAQMACIKPGGLSAHTTEFNPVNDLPTLDYHNLCLYRRQDLERLERRLASQGDFLRPIEYTPVDSELSWRTGAFTLTSAALVIERGGK